MTQRERHTLDNGPAVSSRSSPWEDLFPALPPARQQELLALAARQGFVHLRQLPSPPANGSPAPRRPLLNALLNGQTSDLTPLRPPAVDCIDKDLDPAQRDAVARALHTPDICVIQGGPGTGKSRLITEIIAQAAGRGESVLFVAACPAALDRVLDSLGSHEVICPIRCLGSDERPDALSERARRLTFAERVRAFEEHTIAAAQQAAREAEAVWANYHHDAEQWPAALEVVERLDRLDSDVATLTARHTALAADVERDAGVVDGLPFQVALDAAAMRRDEVRSRVDARLTQTRVEADKTRAETSRLDADQVPLRELADARNAGHWWTIRYWRALFAGDVKGRLEQHSRQRQELAAVTTRLTKEMDDLSAERARGEEQCRTEQAEIIKTETERRRGTITTRLTALEVDRQKATNDWTTVRKTFRTVPDLPEVASRASVEAVRAAWVARCQQAEREREMAGQWAAGLTHVRADFPARLAAAANVVAATPRALVHDPHFGDASGATFDLLVLDEAELLTEADFIQAARRTRRCVLLGEPTPETDSNVVRPARGARPHALRPGFFARLWRTLRWDPRRLPYTWERGGQRLRCRLRPVAPEQEAWIQSERLADRPDVELFILARPRQEPELVEVVFPAVTPIADAKQHLFRELGEVTLRTDAADWCWEETADRITLRLGPPDPDAVYVPLSAGVRELVSVAEDDDESVCPAVSRAVEFERAAGWDRGRAEAWAADTLRLRDLGRTVLLSRPHRMTPALAALLGHILQAEARPSTASTEEVFEFVAVPAGSAHEPRRRDAEARHQGGGTAVATRLRVARGGAGVEVDLAESRRIDAMPADLRAGLPARGLVNYLEARALVRTLEELLADSSFVTAAARWQNLAVAGATSTSAGARAGRDVCRTPSRPAVAIITLYAAQADLINRLLQRVPALLASPVQVEVGLASAFRQRECLLALVSLTRSHTHRAVPYGEGPRELLLALTRAAQRLIVFGDPGTLSRRSQWNGPLDHLDESAAERERGVADRLVRVLQEPELPPGFRVREGDLA
jgi:hypothetical protein